MFATHCRESRRDRLALLGFAAAALAGCVSYEAVPLSPEQSASAVGSRSLDDPGLRDFLEEEEAGTGPWNVNRLALAAAY
ncbi:MAG: hypothetical protein KDM91_22470, partial [Verrucomicrobiae bacterium]|nr:hypothetical protein [Verrucomicrobiae bacterium]